MTAPHECLQQSRIKMLTYLIGIVLTLMSLCLAASVTITGCATREAAFAKQQANENRLAIAVQQAQYEAIKMQLDRIENKLDRKGDK